jgi:hypothetical protein
MSWDFKAVGKCETSDAPLNINPVDTMLVATETITLGAAKANRYSSVIDFIPTDKDGKQLPFVVISNTGATNTSGSASDQLYGSFSRSTGFVQVKNTLRDCNLADDTAQGTSFRSIDAAVKPRRIDPSYVGPYPYYKVRILQAAVESSGMTVGLAVIVGHTK